jgi:hypothetical protein
MDAGPVEFARRVLGVKLWAKQKAILNAIAAQRRVAIRGCHSSGKSFLAAVCALWFAARFADSRILIISPTWMQVRSVLWHEIHDLLAKAKLRLPLDVHNQVEIQLDRSIILGLSTNNPTRLQGHHGPGGTLVVIDECPGIEGEFFPAIEGILAGANTHLVILGNPILSSGYFFEAFRNAGWTRFTISVWDTPNLQGETIESLFGMSDAELDDNSWPMLATKRWVVERHGEWFHGTVENSPLWQGRCLAEFPSSSSHALIPIDWLERARRPAMDNGGEIICGLDPSGGGDLTAGVACAGGAIISSMTSSARESRAEVLAWLAERAGRIRIVYYDSCGLGMFYADPLRAQGYRCEGINVASAAREDKKYSNLKAERFWALRMLFERDAISGLDDDTLTELAAVQWLVNAKGLIEIESKESVRASLGHSPDRCEALMIALGGGPPVSYEYIGIARSSAGQALRPSAPRGATWSPGQGFVDDAERAEIADGNVMLTNRPLDRLFGRAKFGRGTW